MSSDITPGYRAVLDVLGAATPGLHVLHIRHVRDWSSQEQRAELLWFGGTTVSYLDGGADAFERLTRLADEALTAGSAALTVVSNLPGMDRTELRVSLYRVQDGRCVTAEEFARERYGECPESLAVYGRHLKQREAEARRRYVPRSLRVAPGA
ncbi:MULTISPECIES: hypothetical protein [unclassified Streptomyces]|uniref:hypothetical protein n=1 Tax=unclassified Streptomyces TaxID=2593676 RepID=UPI0035D6DFC5